MSEDLKIPPMPGLDYICTGWQIDLAHWGQKGWSEAQAQARRAENLAGAIQQHVKMETACDALKARVAERGDSIYITDGHGTLYGTPEVIGWITDELDRLESTLAQRDREVLALREALEGFGCRTPYGYGCQDHPEFADNRAMWCWVCNTLASTAQAGEDAERRIRAEEAERLIRIITDPHNNIAWRLFRDGESIHADPRHIAAILGTEPNP